MSKTINIIKTLLRTLASRSAVSEPAKRLQVPGLDVTIGRETPCGLVKKDLNTSKDHGFAFPENMREAFGEKYFKWIEYHVSTAGSEVSFIPSLIYYPPVTPSFSLSFLSQKLVTCFLVFFVTFFSNKDAAWRSFRA